MRRSALLHVGTVLVIGILAGTPPCEARGRRVDAARAVRPAPPDAVTLPPTDKGVAARPWRYIVVHHSSSPGGNARIFDDWHRRIRRFPRGLAYHFVIGNGRGQPDGAIEAGARWTRQQPGAHVASALLDGNTGVPMDNVAIGICLVGNHEITDPTPRQVRALHGLIEALRARYGIAPERIL